MTELPNYIMNQDEVRFTLALVVCLFGAYGGVLAIRNSKIQTKAFGTLKGRKAKIVGVILIINGLVAIGLWVTSVLH